MNRIIYIHSNILTICCYQTVKECLERGEKVIIITNRGCTFPFFEGRVMVYDFAKIFQGEDKDRLALHNLKALKDYLRYRKYLAHLHRVVKNIISNEDFIFYMPSMAMVMTKVFAYHKNCKGYYYVDEGYLAYSSPEILKRYIPDKKLYFLKTLLGIEVHYHLEITPKFKGTVSITKEAFSWNNKERIVNPIDNYTNEVKGGIPFFNDVIITDYLSQEYDVLTKCIDFATDQILQDSPNSKVGIKIHPHAITYNKEKTIAFKRHIEERYAGSVTLIPTDVSIEVMSLVHHPNLYSLLEVSSIILYALLFKSSKTALIDFKDDVVTIRDITSIEESMQM